MGNGVFNISKGRVVEYYNRVESNDPSTSALIVLLGTGAISDATLIDLDDVAAIEADAGFAEITDGSYARKTLTDTELAALPAPDDTNDRYEVDLTDLVWSSLAGGDSVTRLIIAYDSDTGAGTDSNLIPLCFYDFVVTTDGTDVTAVFNAAGFYRAA